MDSGVEVEVEFTAVATSSVWMLGGVEISLEGVDTWMLGGVEVCSLEGVDTWMLGGVEVCSLEGVA